MKAFVPLLALLSAVCADPVLHAKWSSFKAAHGKSYESPSHEAARLQAFSSNLALIEAHNARHARGEETYHLGLNHMSDMTAAEIRASKFGARVDAGIRAQLNATAHEVVPGAAYVDWREREGVSSVKNQESCGSCYTFSAVGVVEAHQLKATGYEYDLSEQELVDCSFDRYDGGFNFGCEGGDPATTITHMIQNGISNEVDYKYRSGGTQTHYPCKDTRGRQKFRMHLRSVYAHSEEALASALQNGPIAVTLNGENDEFYNYAGGIYNNSKCSTEINHAVLLVGFGKDARTGMEYWIIKNSWGPTWGEKGYMRMAKGYNRCGIVSADSYYVMVL